MHPLSTENCFNVLSIEEITEDNFISLTDSAENNSKTIPQPIPLPHTTMPTPPILSHQSQFHQHPNWEKHLPNCYIIVSTISANPLKLNVSLQTTDTGEVLMTTALLDSGATNQFIHSDFMERYHLTTKLLSQPIPIFNVYGSPNKAGSIAKVIKVVLWYHNHSEKTTFAVTGLRKQDIILGLTWLNEHNPEVEWRSEEVMMSHCPNHCHTCQNEVNVE
jgi:Retroviral aspartyl protease